MYGVIVKDGIVINRVVLRDDWTGKEGDWKSDDGDVVADPLAQIGYLYDGKEFTQPPDESVKPPTRLQELAAKDTLTTEEVAEAMKLLLDAQ